MNNNLDFDYILKSSFNVLETTEIEFNGVYVKVPEIINIFLELPNFVGHTLNPDTTHEGFCQSMFYVHYCQLTYTIFQIFDMYLTGFYYEANILLRHVVETFFQISYFNKYPNKYKNHCTNKRINISTMIKEFSGKYYKDYYGKHLSSIAHGGPVLKNYYRFTVQPDSVRKEILGSLFDSEKSSGLYNHMVPFLFGYLKIFTDVFPKNSITENLEFKNKYVLLKSWLFENMQQIKNNFPKSVEFYTEIEKILEIII